MSNKSLFNRYDRAQQAMAVATMPNSVVVEFPAPVAKTVKLTGRVWSGAKLTVNGLRRAA